MATFVILMTFVFLVAGPFIGWFLGKKLLKWGRRVQIEQELRQEISDNEIRREVAQKILREAGQK